MAFTASYTFESAAIFTLSNTSISGSVGRLAYTNEARTDFTQSFDSATGFTYNSSYAEFPGTLLRQVSALGADKTFVASYTSSVNGNYGNGTLTGTSVGTVAITGNKLDLTAGSSYVKYSGVGNASTAVQTGCVRVKYTPNYSGTPASTYALFSIMKETGNVINSVEIYHQNTGGTLFVSVVNSVGASIVALSAGAWSPTAGQEYEFELNWDVTAGATRLFIDGVQKGSTAAGTGTRSSDINRIHVGATLSGGVAANGYFADFIIFDAVQHTANYTPGYTVQELEYAETKVDLPDFTYTRVGSIQALTDLTITETGSPKYVIEGQYWNGTAWAVSDGSYAQASSKTDVNANISSLSVAGSSVISFSVVFTDSNIRGSVDTMTLSYTGQRYQTDGYIEPTQPLYVAAFSSYAQTSDADAHVIMKVDGVLKYWSGSAWVTSDGTFAQSNTAADVVSNISSLTLDSNSTVYPRWVLNTTDTQVTPTITSASLTYTFGGLEVTPSTCIVYGYLKDISGAAVSGATVTFTLKRTSSTDYKEANFNTVSTNTVSVTTDSDGYFQSSLIRSSEYEGSGTYYVQIQSMTKSQGSKLEITVPDADTKDITDLLTAY